MIQPYDPQYFVTLVFNDTVPITRATRLLGIFFSMVDGHFLKNDWAKKTEQRVFAIVFPENIFSNTHFHGVFAVAPEFADEFPKVANEQWTKLAPAGNVVSKLIWDLPHAIDYITKQANSDDVMENFIISTQFHSR